MHANDLQRLAIAAMRARGLKPEFSAEATLEAEGWHIGDCERAPNDRQAPLIPVAEWCRGRQAHNPAANDRRYILAGLDCWLRHAWQRYRFVTPDTEEIARGRDHRGRVANGEDVRVTWH